MSESRQRLNRVHFAGFGPPRRRCRGGKGASQKVRTPVHTYVRIYRVIGAEKIIAEDVPEPSSPTTPTSPTEERSFGMVATRSDNGQVAEIPRRDACPQAAPPPSFPPHPQSMKPFIGPFFLWSLFLPSRALQTLFSLLPHSAGACGVRWWLASGVAVIGVGVTRG